MNFNDLFKDGFINDIIKEKNKKANALSRTKRKSIIKRGKTVTSASLLQEMVENSVAIKKNPKFKAGSELADNVESSSPADLKKLTDELVKLTVKEDNKSTKKEAVSKTEPLDVDSDDNGLHDGTDTKATNGEEAGAEVELK